MKKILRLSHLEQVVYFCACSIFLNSAKSLHGTPYKRDISEL